MERSVGRMVAKKGKRCFERTECGQNERYSVGRTVIGRRWRYLHHELCSSVAVNQIKNK